MCKAPKMPKMEPIVMPEAPPPPPPPPQMTAEASPATVRAPSRRARRRQAAMGPSSLAIPLAQSTRPNIPN
jgi:hypothetical protein